MFVSGQELLISAVVFIAPSAGMAKSMHSATSVLKQRILSFGTHQ